MNGTVRRDPDKICDQPASQSTTAPHAVSVTEINKVNTQTGHTQCRALTNSIRQRAENLVEDVHNSLQSRTVGVCQVGEQNVRQRGAVVTVLRSETHAGAPKRGGTSTRIDCGQPPPPNGGSAV